MYTQHVQNRLVVNKKQNKKVGTGRAIHLNSTKNKRQSVINEMIRRQQRKASTKGSNAGRKRRTHSHLSRVLAPINVTLPSLRHDAGSITRRLARQCTRRLPPLFIVWPTARSPPFQTLAGTNNCTPGLYIDCVLPAMLVRLLPLPLTAPWSPFHAHCVKNERESQPSENQD